MEDILYKNSASDVRTRELVNKISKFVNTNKHEFIDFGLPSGTLWATKNVGSKYEYDYGQYFAWGEIKGYNIEPSNEGYQIVGDKKFMLTGDDYAYGEYQESDSNYGMRKYNNTDNKKVLQKRDDAASVAMGGSWHMPTPEQFAELFNSNQVTLERVENYNNSGVNGTLVTSKTDNTKKLFFPHGGICENGEATGVNEIGEYWTNTLQATSLSYQAQAFSIHGRDSSGETSTRPTGRTIRGVIG